MNLPSISPSVDRQSCVSKEQDTMGLLPQICCRLDGLIGERNKRKCKWVVGHRVCWNEYQTKTGNAEGWGNAWGECKDDARNNFLSAGGWNLVGQTGGSHETPCH